MAMKYVPNSTIIDDFGKYNSHNGLMNLYMLLLGVHLIILNFGNDPIGVILDDNLEGAIVIRCFSNGLTTDKEKSDVNIPL